MESEYIDIPVITRRKRNSPVDGAGDNNTLQLLLKNYLFLIILYRTIKEISEKKQIQNISSELIAYVIKYNILFMLHNNIYANVLKNMQLK